MKTPRCSWPVLTLLALLAACGEEGDCPESVGGNSVDGSYCSFSDLDFDRVRITYSEDFEALEISYGKGSAENFSTRFEVIVFTGDVVLEGGRTLPGDILSFRSLPPGGTVLRSETLDRDRSNLVLDEWGGVGGRARGDINLLIELANESGGRLVTFDATFEGTVIEPPFGDGDGG